MDWKQRVTAVTGKVIPDVSSTIYDKVIENEVMSNLPLQMSLYFNVIFFPVWLIMLGILVYDKYASYSEFTKFVTTIMLIELITVEMVRLYLGYEGNLRDKVPELAGFWLLSVLLQLPLQAFLLFNPSFKLRVLDRVVQSVICILLWTQLIAGYKALKHTSKQQATYFRIMKLRNQPSRDQFKEN